jgi:hypothetical protein
VAPSPLLLVRLCVRGEAAEDNTRTHSPAVLSSADVFGAWVHSCPAGGYCPDAGASSRLVFTACGRGTFNELEGASTSAACMPCPAGTTSPDIAQKNGSLCIRCVAGSVAPTPGMAICTRCERGLYASGEGLTACTECKPGRWCTATAEIPCGTRKFNPLRGSSDLYDCLPCPPNSDTYGSDGTRIDNATSVSQCLCEPNTFWNAIRQTANASDPRADSDHASDGQCMPCFAGLNCSRYGAQLHDVRLVAGFWRPSTSSLQVRRCPDADVGCVRLNGAQSVACASGRSGCVGGSRQTSWCAPGLAGVFCLLCANESAADGDRLFRVAATKTTRAHCVGCRADGVVWRTLGYYLLALCVLALALLGAVSLRRHRPHTWKRCAHLWAVSNPPNKIKLLFGFYMIIVNSEYVYEIVLPSSIQAFVNYIRYFITLGMGSVGDLLTCAGLGGYLALLLFWFFLPLALSTLILASHAVQLAHQRRLALRTVLETSLPLLLRLLFVLYPIVTRVAFGAFACYTFDEGSYLVADVSVQCSAPSSGSAQPASYARIYAWAWAAIVVYPFGLLVLVAALLFASRHAIYNGDPTPLSDATAFLHREYDPPFFWWEILEMVRRLVLVGLMILYRRGSITQLVFAMLFSAIYVRVPAHVLCQAVLTIARIACACCRRAPAEGRRPLAHVRSSSSRCMLGRTRAAARIGSPTAARLCC